MPELTVRLATHDDVPTLVDLVTRAYRGDASRVGWTTEADLLDGQRTDAEAIRADLDRERSAVLVGEREGHVVACVHVADDGGTGYLGMFAVDPTLQGDGLGKQLMQVAEDHVAATWGLSAIAMSVIDVRAELIAFYERRGYRRTGETKPFPYGDERFGLPTRGDLRFAVLEKPLAAAGQRSE